MPDPEKILDVVIVGAGPVGLSLALGLARAGRAVLVLEKEAGTSEYSRAPAIWPRTQEILSGLGVIDRMLAGAIVLRRGELWDADRRRVLLRLPFEELADETPFPQLMILPQSQTERILYEALASHSHAEVRFTAEAATLDQDDSHVTVTYRRGGRQETVQSALAVGCDGAHSVVREAIGASFDGKTYGLQAALADVVLDEDGDFPFPRISTRDELSVAIRISDRLWRLILPSAAGEELALDERVRRSVEHHFSTAKFQTTWQSVFRLHRRIASRFAQGRVALAGDAAHLNSPVGGQGMNAGIQDAELLTAALVEALASGKPSPVARYAEARRASIAQGVNRFTDRLTRLLLLRRGRCIKPVLRLVRAATAFRPLRRRLLRSMAMLR